MLFVLPLTSSASSPARKQGEASSARNLAALDEKYGFRDTKLGTLLEQMEGLEESDREDDVTYFRRPSDVLELGNAKLSSIRYGFHRGRLVMIDVRADTENASALLRAFESAYGPGKPKSPAGTGRVWMGKKLMLIFTVARGECRMGFADMAYLTEQLREREQRDANADL
jgi:hypothetical protein